MFPLCGNSAPGGFRHQPDLSIYPRLELPAHDELNESSRIDIDELNCQLDAHHDDARAIWSQRGGEQISEAASINAREYAHVQGLVAGGVGMVHVASAVTAESFKAESPELGCFIETEDQSRS